MIPAKAVEAAHEQLDAMGSYVPRKYLAAALEAAAPHMLADIERELTDVKRVVALLVTEAGGRVSLSRSSITELSDDTFIETTQDVINGGWVIRARRPAL